MVILDTFDCILRFSLSFFVFYLGMLLQRASVAISLDGAGVEPPEC